MTCCVYTKACFAQGVAVETPAAQFIAEMVIAHPGEICILALGPLTNIALSMQYDPRVASHMVRCRTRVSLFVCMSCFI